MGTWGNDIQDNDTYADVEADFLEQLNQGVSKQELLNYFIEDEDFDQEVDGETHDWWFAVADLFWKIGYLDESVFNVVKSIVDTEADIAYWRDCDAEEEDIAERKVALKQFLQRISTPIENPMGYDDF